MLYYKKIQVLTKVTNINIVKLGLKKKLIVLQISFKNKRPLGKEEERIIQLQPSLALSNNEFH